MNIDPKIISLIIQEKRLKECLEKVYERLPIVIYDEVYEEEPHEENEDSSQRGVVVIDI